MKLTINTQEFLHALNTAVGFCEKKTVLPVLGNFLFTAKDQKLSISATDLEIGISLSLPATVEQDDSLTVSAKKIRDIIKECDKDTVSITGNLTHLQVKAGNHTSKLMVTSSEEFPKLPESKSEFIKIEPKVLLQKINAINHAVCTQEERYHLNGIFFKPNGDSIDLVATDGHRLNVISIDKNLFPTLPEQGIIVPRVGINEIKKILSNNNTVDISVTEKHLFFKTENSTISIRLIDGQYPNYERVIPSDNNVIAIIERESFIGVLRRTALLAEQHSHGVTISFKDNTITAKTQSNDVGEASETMDVSYKEKPIDISFNSSYLLDILNSVKDELIMVKINDSGKPILLQYESDSTAKCVVMPMRL